MRSKVGVPSPKDICDVLNDYVIGQSLAKRVYQLLFITIKRLNNPPKSDDVELQKSNILLIGPTGYMVKPC